ncbi:MAG: hypothetical protein DRQ55_04235, partial [Planctomycetota bacterium]
PPGTGFSQIAAGDYHCLALNADGSISGWGWDAWGQVSNAPAGPGFNQVAASSRHGLALRVDGSLVSWGADDWGQVSNTPAGMGFVQVACGSFHCMALRADGSIVSWGADWSGTVSDTPVESGFRQIAGGGYHSLALRADGSVAGWGYDVWGQVSNQPANTGFTHVAAGYGHSMALRAIVPPWTHAGFALAGLHGNPLLVGSGTLAPGSSNAIELSGAAPGALSLLFVALSSTPVTFKGGMLIAFPPVADGGLFVTGGAGGLGLPFVMPPGLPASTELWVQWAIQDAAAVQGVALSNAIKGTTP